jgi:hypothetical protein
MLSIGLNTFSTPSEQLLFLMPFFSVYMGHLKMNDFSEFFFVWIELIDIVFKYPR